MKATSRASSKLLHGGLRYLGNFEFRIVREALRERDAWLRRVPELARPLSIVIPIYKTSRTGRFKMGVGLFLYRFLAPRSPHSAYRWLAPHELGPGVIREGLLGGYEFFDGQSDDYRLGLWVLEQAQTCGVQVRTQTEVVSVSEDGEVARHDAPGNSDEDTKGAVLTEKCDRTVNVAGPWAEALCEASGIEFPFQLDLVRGSHLVLDRPCPQAYLLEVPDEDRLFLVLPWQGNTLVGTTKMRQSIDEPIECSDAEITYLLQPSMSRCSKKRRAQM